MTHLSPDYINRIVSNTLDEDVGDGDLTASLVTNSQIHAELICREQAILCGRDFFETAFKQIDSNIQINWRAMDGDEISDQQIVCDIDGTSRAILTAERSALNLLQTLSGTATTTKHYVDLIKHTHTKILDTRKTIPGLRLAQKYAVTCGGGHNHRIGLFDGILIKENHLRGEDTVSQIVQRAGTITTGDELVEVEVETLEELKEALATNISRILLDNFSLPELEQAVAITNDRAQLEVSGGITDNNLSAIAEIGVDYISIGALTKHIKAIDFSLLVKS